jgi:hypothetical protein|uniref:Ycf33 n=1 Tax=Fibrocapsa japonica TaxID=94617 RepID=UPI00211421B1|nr:Ycf33 [Fibrocapsa japonica]UTE95223.1 Ycf33 [Fibrocapsa japonica]
MLNFWENILRYPKFFGIVIVGLVNTVLFSFFKNSSKNSFTIIITFVFLIGFLGYTLANMLDY